MSHIQLLGFKVAKWGRSISRDGVSWTRITQSNLHSTKQDMGAAKFDIHLPILLNTNVGPKIASKVGERKKVWIEREQK